MIQRSLADCPSPSKNECPLDGFVYLDKENNELTMISTEEAAKQLGLELHSICFSEIFYTPEAKPKWELIADRLRDSIDPELQIKADGIELFESEIVLAQVPLQPNRLEIIWDECREHWLDRLLPLIPARKMEWTS